VIERVKAISDPIHFDEMRPEIIDAHWLELRGSLPQLFGLANINFEPRFDQWRSHRMAGGEPPLLYSHRMMGDLIARLL
jgi:hypothetical protein